MATTGAMRHGTQLDCLCGRVNLSMGLYLQIIVQLKQEIPPWTTISVASTSMAMALLTFMATKLRTIPMIRPAKRIKRSQWIPTATALMTCTTFARKLWPLAMLMLMVA